jgi:hypothetical protein
MKFEGIRTCWIEGMARTRERGRESNSLWHVLEAKARVTMKAVSRMNEITKVRNLGVPVSQLVSRHTAAATLWMS